MNLNGRGNGGERCGREADAEMVRALFPPGTVIVLDCMPDDPRPIASGTKGVVRHVDDIGTMHCSFEGGRQLGLIPGVDVFHKLTSE